MTDFTLTYSGHVKNGELKIHNRAEFTRNLENFEGKDVELVLRRKRKRRSLMQNAYLHVLFTEFTESLNDLGNDFRMPEIKELLKTKFLKIEVINDATGEIIGERVRGTSELTTTELNAFIEDVIRYGAEMFGFILHYPNEQINIDFSQ